MGLRPRACCPRRSRDHCGDSAPLTSMGLRPRACCPRRSRDHPCGCDRWDSAPLASPSYLERVTFRKGESLSARLTRLRVWIQTRPVPWNFITRPSPPARIERSPPTFPMV